MAKRFMLSSTPYSVRYAGALHWPGWLWVMFLHFFDPHPLPFGNTFLIIHVVLLIWLWAQWGRSPGRRTLLSKPSIRVWLAFEEIKGNFTVDVWYIFWRSLHSPNFHSLVATANWFNLCFWCWYNAKIMVMSEAMSVLIKLIKSLVISFCLLFTSSPDELFPSIPLFCNIRISSICTVANQVALINFI